VTTRQATPKLAEEEMRKAQKGLTNHKSPSKETEIRKLRRKKKIDQQ
jgi:DNA-binding transcriptional regulator YiaG